jgi:hydrogenase maturation factor
VDEEEAQRTLEMLEEMGGLAEDSPAENSGAPPAN